MNASDSFAAFRVATRRLLADRRPVLLGMVLTERCNLNCAYCRSHTNNDVHFTFDRAKQILHEAYARGHRAMYVTGGEPMLWRDGKHSLGTC